MSIRELAACHNAIRCLCLIAQRTTDRLDRARTDSTRSGRDRCQGSAVFSIMFGTLSVAILLV
jgi:hypothetical protein